MTQPDIRGAWTVDESNHQSPPQPPPTQTDPDQPTHGWIPLLSALLDAILPHPEAYQAALKVLQYAHTHLNRHPQPT